jgi:NAD(P)-dependent dehydrogenase (short-subunit alcohol dehydrogenase family)
MRPTLKTRPRTVRTVIERWGRLDVLVSSAGAGAGFEPSNTPTADVNG